MKINKFKASSRISAIALLLFLTGCASTNKVIEIDKTQWKQKETKVSVYVKPLPKAHSHKAGSQGFLDMAINSSMAKGVTKHVNEIEFPALESMKAELEQYLASQNVKVVALAADYTLPKLEKIRKKKSGFARKDYTTLRNSLGADQLLVVDVAQLGTLRRYYGFIPLNAPQGYFRGSGQLIDLATNQILWNQPAEVIKDVDGEWDKPEEGYPDLTKTILAAASEGKETIVSHLKK